MRSQVRAVVLVVVSLITAVTLGVASAFVSAVAFGATALIVPGTGTPNADVVDGYRENAWSRYIDGVACTEDCSDPDLVGIPYPASFWPVSFIPGWCVTGRCDKWNVSVGEGTENLLDALAPFLDPESDEDVYIFGYSQGGAVVANALAELALLDLPDSVKDRLKTVTIGGIENPDGGLWQRLAWLQLFLGNPVPILDLSFDPAMPVDIGIDTTSIGFEYDPVVYAPKYWGNPFAILNMIAAFDEVHGYYLTPNENSESPMAYGYDDETLAPQLNCSLNPGNCRTDSFGNTYIMIPATSLPLTNLIRSLADSLGIGGLAKPFIDLVEPVVRELVDLGYDWSGNPGVPSRSTILPFKIFQNWLKVGVDFAIAAVKGVEAFIRNFIPAPVAQNPDATTVTVSDDEGTVEAATAESETLATVTPLRSTSTPQVPAVETDVADADADGSAAVAPPAEDEDGVTGDGAVPAEESDTDGGDADVTTGIEDDVDDVDVDPVPGAEDSGAETDTDADTHTDTDSDTDTDTDADTGADTGAQAAA